MNRVSEIQFRGGDEILKYTPDEAFYEIKQRSNKIIRDRKRMMCRTLTVVCSVLLMMVVTGIMIMPRKNTVTLAGTLYGSFLLSQEAGGYVLVALLAFVLGVTVTLLCQKFGKNRKDE